MTSKPTRTSIDFTFDDLYDEISYDWRAKAQRLQSRRWKAIKREDR